MFTLNHFIWLAICAGIIILMFFINKEYKLSLSQNLLILSTVCFLSESFKIFLNIAPSEFHDGYYLIAHELPFHLCSIQIFFFFYLTFLCKDEKVRDNLLGFMFPTCLAGGVAALLIPTLGVEFTTVQNYQYFLYHAFIVYFAIYLVSNKIITITKKTILNNYIYLIIIMFITLWINSFLQVYEDVNFLFLAKPPLEGLPILNLNHGWYGYFASLATLAFVGLFLIQIPFVKKDKQ